MVAEECFDKIDIYEQQVDAGGAWNYSSIPEPVKINIPQTNPIQPCDEPLQNVDSTNNLTFMCPMYDHLETNIPVSLMRHSDQPFPKNSPLFPKRELVLDYLCEYAKDVRHLIKFSTQVVDVRLQTPSNYHSSWYVTSKDLIRGKLSEEVYDAVAVCSGHYTIPYIPDIRGLQAWNESYPGQVSHSKFYRKPDTFAGKTVLIVGNAASGLDIASQIVTVSSHPLFVSSRTPPVFSISTSPNMVEEVPEIVEFLDPSSATRAVRLKDDRIVSHIDAVLFCTGYLYSFPFLSSLGPHLQTSGFHVPQTYQHMFSIPYPTLAFLGLPMKVLPFPLAEAQAAVIARVWSSRLQLPTTNEMLAWEKQRVDANGEGKKFHSFGPPEDFLYHNELYDWAANASGEMGKLPNRWDESDFWLRERFAQIKKAYSERGEVREDIRTLEELGFDYDAWIFEQRNEEE